MVLLILRCLSFLMKEYVVNQYKSFLIIVSFISLVFLSGCCGGSDKTVTVESQMSSNSLSIGSELLMLHEAREKGALTEEEFQESKKKLLSQ